MFRIVAQSWCHERDRRWPDYHSQAAATPWPRSFIFAESAPGLMVLLSGSGGGSQQATFRNELEARLTSAWARVPRAGGCEERLLRLETELQQSFVTATEPAFAAHFQATWVAALTDGVHCALRSQGTERAWLKRGSALTQLTHDASLFLKTPPAGAPKPDELLDLGFPLASFGSLPSDHRSQTAGFDWQRGDVLLMATALPVAPHPALDAAAPSLDARGLYETFSQAVARAKAGYYPPLPNYQSKGAVLLARVE